MDYYDVPNNFSVSGGTVNILITTIQHKDIKKAGSIPGIINSEDNKLDSIAAIPSLSQIITVNVPDIIPAIAPHFVVRFHQSDKIIKGPNEAASPPQAKATKK